MKKNKIKYPKFGLLPIIISKEESKTEINKRKLAELGSQIKVIGDGDLKGTLKYLQGETNEHNNK